MNSVEPFYFEPVFHSSRRFSHFIASVFIKWNSLWIGYAGFECYLSRHLNVSLLHLEYRLVPEHPMPAAVDDALTLYRALLLDGISPSRLVIMGDSAGGGLTLLTVQALVANHLPIPRAIIAMSPWADLSASSESYSRNRLTDVMIPYESVSWGIEQALGPDHGRLARDNPSYSPIFGSFEDFPPMYITVGTAELVEDDARRVAEKSKKSRSGSNIGSRTTYDACASALLSLLSWSKKHTGEYSSVDWTILQREKD